MITRLSIFLLSFLIPALFAAPHATAAEHPKRKELIADVFLYECLDYMISDPVEKRQAIDANEHFFRVPDSEDHRFPGGEKGDVWIAPEFLGEALLVLEGIEKCTIYVRAFNDLSFQDYLAEKMEVMLESFSFQASTTSTDDLDTTSWEMFPAGAYREFLIESSIYTDGRAFLIVSSHAKHANGAFGLAITATR